MQAALGKDMEDETCRLASCLLVKSAIDNAVHEDNVAHELKVCTQSELQLHIKHMKFARYPSRSPTFCQVTR